MQPHAHYRAREVTGFATLPDGRELELTAGGQNDLVKKIVEEFCPRFTPGGVVVYVGDTGDKQRHIEARYLERLGAEMDVVLVVPEFQLSTIAARKALPEKYSRQDAVFNVQRVALLLAALSEGRSALFREAMRDRLHQPYRAPLIPGLEEILQLRDVPGLLGVALSGAGPSVLAFCSGHSDKVGAAIVSCFRAKKIEARARRLPLDTNGFVIERLA